MVVLECAIFCVAMLYATVGHAGASGYVAVFALAGESPQEARAHALVCNLIVATVATYRFRSFFRKELFTPLVLGSIPASYLMGTVAISRGIFSVIIGGALWFSAVYLVCAKQEPAELRKPSWLKLLSTGSCTGLLAGLTGTGGGIFLSPLLIFSHVARLKEASAVAAPFIFLNSLSGLFGLASYHHLDFTGISWHILAALSGGFVGASVGSAIKVPRNLRLILALVLVLAGMKLVLVGSRAIISN